MEPESRVGQNMSRRKTRRGFLRDFAKLSGGGVMVKHLQRFPLAAAMVLSAMPPTAVMAEQTSAFHDPFETLDEGRWHVADYDFDHPHFDTDWRRRQVQHEGSASRLALVIAPRAGASLAPRNRFEGASLRRRETSGFGRYEADIKPARGAGLVTGFFLYTGPYYGTRHDEIDIEFLGKNTRMMQASWFVDGALQTRQIPLGFDAAAQSRRYAFEWWPDRLRWFVGAQMVFEVTREQAQLPEVPGHLYLNLWAAAPSLANWAGRASPQTRGKARINAVRFTPLADLNRAA